MKLHIGKTSILLIIFLSILCCNETYAVSHSEASIMHRAKEKTITKSTIKKIEDKVNTWITKKIKKRSRQKKILRFFSVFFTVITALGFQFYGYFFANPIMGMLFIGTILGAFSTVIILYLIRDSKVLISIPKIILYNMTISAFFGIIIYFLLPLSAMIYQIFAYLFIVALGLTLSISLFLSIIWLTLKLNKILEKANKYRV